jgi:predicted unusual protein kinase regulating ubiquinone biosynthesis (AarF/ABC1/UbiB family)
MDIIRLLGVIVVEYPRYLITSNYDSGRFWNKCIQINTLYTKVLQAVAVHYISDTFYYHFNNVPYELDEIPEIEHITPKHVIGSGMISIVMEAMDATGKPCIVKAKRKGIDSKIIQGLHQLKHVVGWLHYLPLQFPIDFVFSQFETMMLEQLSFENEIKQHQLFKKNNAYNTNLVVPDIMQEYCTSTQIVMSKIEGSHYTSIMSKDVCDTHVRNIVEMAIKNLVIDGFIHSDLHAGNMLFTEDHKIGIIDYGLMVQFTIQERKKFFNLLRYLSIQDYENAVDIVITDLVEPEHIKNSLTDTQQHELKQLLIDLYIQIYSIRKTFTVKDVCSIIRVVYKYNLTISNVFYKLMFFIVSSECFINQLSPNYLHVFMDKITELFTEIKEDEDEQE